MNKLLSTISKHLIKSTLSLVAVTLSTAPVYTQNIIFQHENTSDLRGLLNLFHAFEQSCLTGPVSRGLPVKLLPDGYQIVSREKHNEFDEHKNSNRAAILSKTGLEQMDWDEGHIYVDLLMPTDAAPFGECSVYWKRGWDDKDVQDKIALGMFGVLDAQISYNLQAVLTTRPPDAFSSKGAFAGTSDWSAHCWDNKVCDFRLIYEFSPTRGIDISFERMGVRD